MENSGDGNIDGSADSTKEKKFQQLKLIRD